MVSTPTSAITPLSRSTLRRECSSSRGHSRPSTPAMRSCSLRRTGFSASDAAGSSKAAAGGAKDWPASSLRTTSTPSKSIARGDLLAATARRATPSMLCAPRGRRWRSNPRGGSRTGRRSGRTSNQLVAGSDRARGRWCDVGKDRKRPAPASSTATGTRKHDLSRERGRTGHHVVHVCHTSPLPPFHAHRRSSHPNPPTSFPGTSLLVRPLSHLTAEVSTVGHRRASL
jgi:hypothetical protein